MLLPWQQLCHRFYRKQEPSTPNNLMGRVKTIWEPCVFWARPSAPLANEVVWFFTERDWSQECCHGNNTAAVFLEIFLVQYLIVKWNYLWCHNFPHLHNAKAWISLKQKEIFQKGKCHSFLLCKAFKIRSDYFFTS